MPGCRCKETVTGRGRMHHQMDTPSTIGEAPGSSGLVDSRRPAKDRVNRANVIRGARIVKLAQASRSYVSRMLCNGVFVLLVGVCIGAVAAHAQNATWLLSPTSGDFDTAANWSPATAVPTGTGCIRCVKHDHHHVLKSKHVDRQSPVQRRSAGLFL
jgi:hypothetical protein